MVVNGGELIQVLPLRDLYTDYRNHRRLKVFVHNGRQCVTCDREGVFLLVTEFKDGSRHVDLFTKDFTIITVDHTVPKKLAREMGWSYEQIESLDNKQTMCGPCNWGKGHKDVTNEEWKSQRRHHKEERVGDAVIWQLTNNQNVFNTAL